MSKNILKKGKTALLAISILLMVVSIALCVVGIILAVRGFGMIGVDGANLTSMILLIVFGLLMAVMGIVGFCASFIMIWTGSVMKTNLGNTKDYTIPKGTLNMQKCPNCGTEIKPDDKICGNCGHSLAKTKKCESCGQENDAERKFCDGCGKEF